MQVEYVSEFNVLAECLNFRSASKRLYVSQPTLSKHLSTLEQELGFKLLEREPAVRLTPSGEAFYRRRSIFSARLTVPWTRSFKRSHRLTSSPSS